MIVNVRRLIGIAIGNGEKKQNLFRHWLYRATLSTVRDYEINLDIIMTATGTDARSLLPPK